MLVLLHLQAFDTVNAEIGADRNPHVSGLDTAPPEWKRNDVRPMASVSTAVHGNITLGIAVGPRQCVTDQLLAKADVKRAVHERVQLCQNPQTEFVLLRESLGVNRINHIFRAHGHTILNKDAPAETFGEAGQRSFERLFPGFTEDSTEQAALSAGQSGVGYKRSVDVARPAHLGAVIAANTRILDIFRDAATAGFLPEQPLLVCLDTIIETATAASLDALDDPAHSQAVPARSSPADDSWQQTVQGHNGPTITNPTVPDVEQSGLSSQHNDEDSESAFASP